MPALGFGTWALNGDECKRAVREALDVGYRHIDTAEMYGNEEEVGYAIQRSAVTRDQVFLATKVWHDHLDTSGVSRALEGSLRRLRTDYVDLFLIHWPNPGVPLEETLAGMSGLKAAGKAKHIGVSNFTVAQLREAQQCSGGPVFCNQVEYHPYLCQDSLLAYCRSNNILLVAYCPLARGRVFSGSLLQQIGQGYGKTAGQVALRWLLQQDGVGLIPRSASSAHIRENFQVFDFELTDEEMGRISRLAKGERIVNSFGPQAQQWDA